MICPKCNKPINDSSIECPFCGIVIGKYKPAESPDFTKYTAGSSEQKNSSKILYLIFGILGVVAIAAVLLLVPVFRPKQADGLIVISHETNEETVITCKAKEKCVIAYLAPW
jgi:type IV secretory pathway component VirB8